MAAPTKYYAVLPTKEELAVTPDQRVAVFTDLTEAKKFAIKGALSANYQRVILTATHYADNEISADAVTAQIGTIA